MKKEDARKYLRIVGQRLQAQQITGEILLSSGVVLLLDIKKPQVHKDIDAYLQGDENALALPNDIASYFGGDGAALRIAVTEIALQERLPADWLDDALQALFFVEPVSQRWIEYPGVRAYLASPEYTLAIRVATAIRPQAIEEGRILAKNLQVESFPAMLLLVQKYIPEPLCTPDMFQAMKAIFA
jgi:hypothetical protein